MALWFDFVVVVLLMLAMCNPCSHNQKERLRMVWKRQLLCSTAAMGDIFRLHGELSLISSHLMIVT